MSRVSTPPTAKPMTPPPVQIAHERIAKRAYEKWMKRGCPQGTAFQDWLEAEAELVAEASRGTSNTSSARR